MPKALKPDPVESLINRLDSSELPEPDERRAIRERAGLSLAEMAGQLGVDTVSLWRWERGLTVPYRSNAIMYRRALDALSAREAAQ